METKKYLRKKNPRVEGFSIVRVVDGCQRILFTDFPTIKNFLTDQSITNGLGYLDNGNQIPHYGDSQEGLIRHLANMDMEVVERNFAQARYLMEKHFDALIQVEDIAQNISKYKQWLIEEFADFVNRLAKIYGEDFSGDTREIVERAAKV